MNDKQMIELEQPPRYWFEIGYCVFNRHRGCLFFGAANSIEGMNKAIDYLTGSYGPDCEITSAREGELRRAA
jgi:hypothetical protein